MESMEFGDVVQEMRGAMQPGRLKLSSDIVTFRNVKTGKTEQLSASEIKNAQWLIRARGYCLKLITINNSAYRFDGMKESEFDKLSEFIKKHYNTTLEKVDRAVKGWNWGTAKFKGNALDFVVGHHTAFEVPLNNVGHCTQGKNEVTLEFHQNDDAAISLMELRFHIPSDPSADTDPVNEFYKNVMAKADIIQATGDAVATFAEAQCLTPRGRYDFKIYPTFLHLHGKTFDYKIPYKTILRLFLLPHMDGRQMFFVISLDPPIKQGQTRYPFLILLFNKDEETTLELGLKEEDINEKYEGKLQKEMTGPEYEIISRIMKTLVQRKITVPGSFTNMAGGQCVGCSYKAAQGYLYPLERGFMFIHKPPLHIRFDEISGVNFARSSGSTRSFDFEIDTKTGSSYMFSGMQKDEYGKMYDFVVAKHLLVKNIAKDKGAAHTYDDDLGDSDEEPHHDAYLQRVKREAAERSSGGEDDSDSDDEDFVAGSSGSEVAEEYDSQVESSTDTDDRDSDEDDEARKERKRVERENKLEKKQRKRKRGGTSEKRRSKRKVKKDKNAPKRPMTAYFLWLNDNRERIKTENPQAGLTDVTKIGGEEWKKVDEATKKEYQSKFEAAKEAYKKAYAEYIANKPPSEDEDSGEEKKKKKKRKKVSSSPVKDSKAGAGENYKSKEFISDEESSSSSTDDSDDEPLKGKGKSKKSGSDSDSPDKKKSKKEDKLPSDEEILSDPSPGSSDEASD